LAVSLIAQVFLKPLFKHTQKLAGVTTLPPQSPRRLTLDAIALGRQMATDNNRGHGFEKRVSTPE
jgi:hypothetical protein